MKKPETLMPGDQVVVNALADAVVYTVERVSGFSIHCAHLYGGHYCRCEIDKDLLRVPTAYQLREHNLRQIREDDARRKMGVA